MNWLGKIGVTVFFLGIACFIILFISTFFAEPSFTFELLVGGFFLGVILGMVFMFISALYDRYHQLKTEQTRPRI